MDQVVADLGLGGPRGVSDADGVGDGPLGRQVDVAGAILAHLVPDGGVLHELGSGRSCGGDPLDLSEQGWLMVGGGHDRFPSIRTWSVWWAGVTVWILEVDALKPSDQEE